jgi:hypothetical protein
MVNYDIWCPDPRLGNDAPSLKALMKKPTSNLPDDQPMATLKIKQPATSQKRTSKKAKAASSKQLQSLADAAAEVFFPLISQLYSILVHQLSLDSSGCCPRIYC